MLILKNKAITFTTLLLVTFVLCEKIYNYTTSSGIYNKAVISGLILLGFGYLYMFKIKFTKYDLFRVLFAFLVGIYGFSKESIRYCLTLFLIIIWSKIEIKNLKQFHKAIIILGFLFSIYERLHHIVRLKGFFSGSPTLFAFSILISIMYFLFEEEFDFSNIIYISLGFLLIVGSATSSVLICGLGFLLYKVGITFFQYAKLSQISQIKLIIVFSTIAILLLLINIEPALSIISRGNRQASTATRMGIIKIFAGQFFSNIQMFLIGYGGGYTQKNIVDVWNATSHLPIHQDVLMFLCEYGLLGCLSLYYIYLKKSKFYWLVFILILLGSFHNLILSPICICIIYLTSNSLNLQYNELKRIWR